MLEEQKEQIMHVPAALPEEQKTSDSEATLDDLLQCFTAEGVYMTERLNLLKPFLTTESLALMTQLLDSTKDEKTIGFILTSIAFTIIEERFHVFRGEYELIQKKSKRAQRQMKSNVSSEIQDKLDQIIVKEESL